MNDFIELRKVIAIVARRWWLLILLTGMVAVAGFAYSQSQARVYQGSVTLLVGTLLQLPQVERNDVLVSEMLAQTYADLARRQPVLQGAIDALNLTASWTSLRSRVSVSLVEGTQLLQIKVQAGSPSEARSTAGAIARQLILLSPTVSEDAEETVDQAFVGQRLESLRQRIETGQARLAKLEAQETEGVDTLSTEGLKELRSEISTLEGLITEWETSYREFLTLSSDEQAPNSLTIIEPAHASSRPIKPQLMLNTLVAGAVGFGLAAALIFVLEFLDDTIKSTEELNQVLGLTALGTVGRIGKPADALASLRLRGAAIPWTGGLSILPLGTKDRQRLGKLVAQLQPSSPVAEDFRAIWGNIQFLTASRPVKSILVTSAVVGEGKSVVAANLGIVMAQAGLKAILVDANLRHPVLHDIFGLSNAAGLSDLFGASECEVNGMLQDPHVEGNLLVLTSGKVPSSPSVLFASNRMCQILAELNEQADVVIVDSPPVMGATDSALLAKAVDGTIVVTREGQTRRKEAKHTVSSIGLANGSLLGAVLNARRKGAGWVAAMAVGAVLTAGSALMMLSGRRDSSAVLPTTPSETPAFSTSAAVDSPAKEAAPTAAPQETAVEVPATIVEPTDAATPEWTATLTREPATAPTTKNAAVATVAPASTPMPELMPLGTEDQAAFPDSCRGCPHLEAGG
jgi:capsular exopolysaccharide synthesis family protein